MRNNIHFFGTTGDKDLMFSSSLLPGGVFLNVDEVKIVLDPGLGTLTAFSKKYPSAIYDLDAIILSHIHFDHSNEINIFIEGMTQEGNNRKGRVFAPNEAIAGENAVIKSYVQNMPEEIVTITPESTYSIKNISFKSSIPHRHGVENYGFVFYTQDSVISFLTDTAYFDELPDSYKNSDVLVVNVPYANTPAGKKMKHLSLDDFPKLIDAIKPKKVFLTHFGASMLNANPTALAKELSQKFSIDVIAVSDNTAYDV